MAVAPATERIQTLIGAYPGITRTGLCEMTNRCWGTIGHHVAELLQHGLIIEARVGRQAFLYRTPAPTALLATNPLLGDPVNHRIWSQLLDGDRTLHELALAIQVPRRIARRHVDVLAEAGLVQATKNRELHVAIIRPARAGMPATGEPVATA